MPPRIRKEPIRTCVVCREAVGKKELLRIVRTPEGEVVLDPTGKKSGRGAYLRTRPECRQGQQAQRQLSRALGIPVDPGPLLSADR